MFCVFCGNKLAENANFCSSCGKQVGAHNVQVVNAQVNRPVRICPRCNTSNIQYQTVTESKKTGCLTVIGYFLLAVTILGLFILIPLLLRKKTVTTTYAVCQNCGNRWKVS